MCTSHKFILSAISVPKIIKVGGNLTKLWQKQFCTVFWDTVYILIRKEWQQQKHIDHHTHAIQSNETNTSERREVTTLTYWRYLMTWWLSTWFSRIANRFYCMLLSVLTWLVVRLHSYVEHGGVFIGKFLRLVQMKLLILSKLVLTGLSALDIELRHRRSSFVHKLSCSTNSVINALFALKLWTGWCFFCFSFFSSSRVFCHCIAFCLSLSVCLFATHVVNKDLYNNTHSYTVVFWRIFCYVFS